jgi:membrane protease YdiL (CAAX protease family)
MMLFIFLGGLYSFYLSLPFGVIMAMVALFNLNMLLSGELFFSRTQNISFVLSMGVLFVVAELGYFLSRGVTFPSITDNATIVTAIFRANFTLVLFEEIIFRSIIWRYLQNWGLKNYQVIFAQAFLFWIIHFYYYSQLVLFWIYLPFISILYGVIVYKSKSILPSFVMHYLHNFAVALLFM